MEYTFRVQFFINNVDNKLYAIITVY